MEPIVIHLKEDAGVARINEPVYVGAPFRQGELKSNHLDRLGLFEDASGLRLAAQFEVLSLWPDKSVRWLGTRFLVALGESETALYRLQIASESDSAPETKLSAFEVEDGSILVSTGRINLTFSPSQLQWTSSPEDFESTKAKFALLHRFLYRGPQGDECSLKVTQPWKLVAKGPVSVLLEFAGHWVTPANEQSAHIHSRIEIFADSGTIKMDTRLHNPERALHLGGLWDLGDKGSMHFEALEFLVEAPESGSARLQVQPSQSFIKVGPGKSLLLYQDSSGGTAWQSANHVNAEGKPVPTFRGYKLLDGNTVLITGDRANPCASLFNGNLSIQASQPHFWQNFPSSLQINRNGLTVGLFPRESAESYELQGGEQKTHTTWLSYSSDPSALSWVHHPTLPTLSARHYQDTEAFPWFRANIKNAPLDTIIYEGLEGPQNFFAKREIIDEYGWRNFGEIFADHETLYQSDGDEPYISHYNNQYDAIYGFARQFARTGDRRWFELMDDLAGHVSDIDIYHTSKDRSEYNNGLFWHTDHYLPASTATHRTFSRHNKTSSTPGQVGGGPAAEHCYTTGLLYHFYLTGTSSSRQAVLDLADWIRSLHEGNGGFLEQILALKKREIPQAIAKLKGGKPSLHTYPFTRGTGNYLNALMDAWQLEPEKDWLHLAERVIQQTIHPADNINERKLLDVETGWSYLVLLASLNRYLWLKAETGQMDNHYEYAWRSLTHYTRWMLANEEPFLARPERLEYPNHTWTAQELRKAMLLFQAASIDPEMAEHYRILANQWLNDICNTIQSSDESHFSRVQVILLQNYGPHQLETTQPSTPQSTICLAPSRLPQLTWARLAGRVAMRLIKAVATFRPGRERAWLKTRLNRS